MTSKRKVLVVDDERNIIQMLRMLLETRGYDVEIATSGEEAIAKAETSPDLILLDLILPDIEGFEVCRKLRERDDTRQIPIIILSVKYLYEDKVEGLYLGADDYLTKPFDHEELFARIEAVLRRRFTFDKYFLDKEPIILELRNIIKKEFIITYYQPIFRMKPFQLLGFEVLSRPPVSSILANPEVMFKSALRFGLYCDLEMLAWRTAASNLPTCPEGTKMFLNCNPYIIESPEFYKIKSTFDETHIDIDDVVLEITERSAIADYKMFYERLQFYRNCGVQIAIDDLGGGFASLESIVSTAPTYVKIDNHIIRNMKNDSLKRSIVKFITEFCHENEIITIAEGIETKEDYQAVLELNVDAGQGYLFCKPTQEFNILDVYERIQKDLGIEIIT